MCSNAENAFALAASVGKEPNGSLPSLDQYRLQLYNYAMAERIRLSQLPYAPIPPYGYAPRLALSMSLYQRALAPEEPKPQHSYIGLIAMAILSVPDCKLVLSDIYQHILDNYPYFRSRGPGWRNSIRHNLSLNDCFVKAGRSANGKGHYWAIHPANVEDFRKGDFRRRKAQRKVRKHMGLAVDDEGDDSPSPPPASPPTLPALCAWAAAPPATVSYAPLTPPPRKRLFDVASLLAPDEKRRRHDTDEEDIDVVSGAGEELDSPAAPSPRYPFVPGWSLPALEPGALLGRYYEHLAAAHYHRLSVPPPRASPATQHDEHDHAPSP